MVEKRIFPRWLRITWHFRPRLEFYGHFDEIGLELESEFPDWMRNERSLLLANRQKHRKLELSNGTVVFERYFEVFSDLDEEVKNATRIHDNFLTRFNVQQYKSLSFETHYALQVDHGFEAIALRLRNRFFVRNETIEKIHGADVRDVQYAMDFGADYKLGSVHFGPMTKEEWFQQRFPPNGFLFESAGEHTYKRYLDEFPSPFIYYYRLCEQPKIDFESVKAKVEEATTVCLQSAKSFMQYYNKGEN